MCTIGDLEQEYAVKHSRSRYLYQKALTCFPSGVTHSSRFVLPFPIYAVRAEGTRTWDVDGNEYVDYVMGHGTLLLGYGDKRVNAAFQEQIPRAVHMGASTELEIEWAELIQKLVPCARGGLVKATSCGTEANMIAIRMARVYTGRDKIVVHAGCYHGNLDATLYARDGKHNIRGIPHGVRDDVMIVPYNNLEAVEEAFACGDVACLLLQGNAPYTRKYIEGLRRLTRDYGVLFILDEVVSGFRYAAGGAQEYYGVTPDVATLGKIAGGGAPVGAICGNREIMEIHAFKDDYWNRFVRLTGGGTWNAQPIAIIGGISMMKIIESERGAIYPALYRIGQRLTHSYNQLAQNLGVSAIATGLPPENPTQFDLNFLNGQPPDDLMRIWQEGPNTLQDYDVKRRFTAGSQAVHANYLVMVNSGVSPFSSNRFNPCTKYTEEDLQITETAFDLSLRTLKENKLIGLTT
jgi:glutamate-1-semialdehyde 2,1-aminomutase